MYIDELVKAADNAAQQVDGNIDIGTPSEVAAGIEKVRHESSPESEVASLSLRSNIWRTVRAARAII